MAIVPAMIAAVVITSAGLMFVRLMVSGTEFFGPADWGALAPEVLWPIWGAALAAAALAYGFRRREACPTCGRGPGEVS